MFCCVLLKHTQETDRMDLAQQLRYLSVVTMQSWFRVKYQQSVLCSCLVKQCLETTLPTILQLLKWLWCVCGYMSSFSITCSWVVMIKGWVKRFIPSPHCVLSAASCMCLSRIEHRIGTRQLPTRTLEELDLFSDFRWRWARIICSPANLRSAWSPLCSPQEGCCWKPKRSSFLSLYQQTLNRKQTSWRISIILKTSYYSFDTEIIMYFSVSSTCFEFTYSYWGYNVRMVMVM